MRVLVAVASIALIAVLLAEFFVVFLLPRRVKRDPRVARGVFRTMWRPWRVVAARLPPTASDTMLGLFGPLGLLTILGLLSAGVILGFGGLHWANSSRLGPPPIGFWHDLYFSAGAFFSTSTASPTGSVAEALQVMEAATGFGFLAIAIGYLPALFQAFSRRETAVSRLDPRAGSPPTAASLLQRSGARGGWRELDEYLREWETWSAELMETHLSYPILAYFRSQHLNMNWLAALTTVVDACAYALAYGPQEETEAAELTFRIGRHALADLMFTLTSGRSRANPPADRQRLTPEALEELRQRLEDSGLQADASEGSTERLTKLRGTYEPYALAISRQLALELPDWLPAGKVRAEWFAAIHRRDRGLLP